ncbi:GPN [Mytilus coruscus]|uniref:GPN n=1 Tax=Mytilus coruscus TaxID=42192 RepID=A0A6J8AIW9_MYTCO|nr:GPN [Mytilus coruscus]
MTTSNTILPFQSPCTFMVSGATQSGKTTFIMKLLTHASTMFKAPPVKTIYCYTEFQPVFEHGEKTIPNFILHEGFPTRSDIIEWTHPDKHTVIVLDDMMRIITQEKDVVSHNQQGELVLNGGTITGSNILDIIKYTVSTRQRKTPVGSKEFQDLLHKLDVPKILIAERKGSSLTQSGGLFVKGNGRRDILPGTSNKKENIRWLKY